MGKMEKKYVVLFAITVLLFFSLQGAAIEGKAVVFEHEEQSFVKEEMEWRVQRDKQMRSPTSWLTVAGLFWLEEKENGFGTALTNKIILPSGSAPPFAGKFIFKEGKIKVLGNEGVTLKVDGEEIKEMVLRGDDEKRVDVLELGELRMWVIKRGERYAIRLRNLNAAAYKDYKGLELFPPLEKFKIEAILIPFAAPKNITVATAIGTETEMKSPGYVKFVIDGKEFRLDAFAMDDQNRKLFFIFKDDTNGDESYGAGRFMVSDVLENEKVDLNFNRAYNPPCAYTPYATCPLAPPQNWLNIRIEAGEKKYKGGHH